jgi:hypothetical protein
VSSSLELRQIKKILLKNEAMSYVCPPCVFIGPILGGNLKYMHKLFSPLADAEERLRGALGWPPPPAYSCFFSFSDGAILFDNTVFIYGLNSSISRDLRPENVRPISLKRELENWRAHSSSKKNWALVGSVAGYSSRYSIEICVDGRTRINTQESTSRTFPCFLSALLAVIKLAEKHCDANGVTDLNALALERELDSLTGSGSDLEAD